MSRPEHIDREPAANILYNEIVYISTTVDLPTRSKLTPLPRPSLVTTLADEFNRKRAEAIQAFNAIIDAVDQNGGQPFFDKDFFLGHRNNLYPDGSPDDCTVGEPQSVARAEEIYPGAPLFAGAGAMAASAKDLVQGRTGNCFFIAGVASLSNFATRQLALMQKDPTVLPPFSGAPDGDPVKRLFVAVDIPKSVYTLMYYLNGEWNWVIVDGLLATDRNGKPLYANCNAQQRELWPMILEKAYFKIFCSVDASDGGHSSQAIVTLSGGVRIHRDIEAMRWGEFYKLGSNPMNLLTSSLKPGVKGDGGEAGRAGETSGPAGLYGGHAYSVLDVCETSDKKVRLVKQMNPWASGEYKGKWSDSSPEWKQFPKYAKEMKWSNADDGIFFMDAATFRQYMEVDLVKIFPDTSQMLTMSSIFGANAEEDDVYIFKVDKPGHYRFMVGQYDTRSAPAMLGLSAQSHRILKGRENWPEVSEKIGMRVFHHSQGAPRKETFATTPYKKQLAAIVGYGDTWLVDIQDCPTGYISMMPILDGGTAYYVRVVAPPGSDSTVYRLSEGIESAIGNIAVVEGDNFQEEPTVPEGEELAPVYQQEITADNQMADDDDYDAYDEEGGWDEVDLSDLIKMIVGMGVEKAIAEGWLDEEDVEEFFEAVHLERPDLKRNHHGGQANHAPYQQQITTPNFARGRDGPANHAPVYQQQIATPNFARGRGGPANHAPVYQQQITTPNFARGRGGPANHAPVYQQQITTPNFARGRGGGGGTRAAPPEDIEQRIAGHEVEQAAAAPVFDDDELYRMFVQFDLDGSGELDRSEAMAAITHFFEDDSPSAVLKRIQEADVNGDGKLDFAEFAAIVRDTCGRGGAIYQEKQNGGYNDYDDYEEELI